MLVILIDLVEHNCISAGRDVWNVEGQTICGFPSGRFEQNYGWLVRAMGVAHWSIALLRIPNNLPSGPVDCYFCTGTSRRWGQAQRWCAGFVPVIRFKGQTDQTEDHRTKGRRRDVPVNSSRN